MLTTASCSVDAHTDELIRRVMLDKFSKHTVLSVVHKLESALDDYDVVAVLDAGQLCELGPPRELLQRGPEASAFAALYETLAVKSEAGSSSGEADTEIGNESSDGEKIEPADAKE